MNSAAIPEKATDVQGDDRWMSVHNRFVNQAKELEPEVLFIGDSLLANLGLTDLWEQWFAPMHSLNFGIGGDQTQHVLWRINNGELEYIKPQVIVVLVGTNNHSHSCEEVAEGIIEIYHTLRSKQPQALVVLLTIPPRGFQPNRLRDKNNKVNEIVNQRLKDAEQCEIIDIGEDLVQADGSIDYRDMYDYLHFTWQGYRKAFKPLYEFLLNTLQEDEQIVNHLSAQATTPSPISGPTD